MMPPKGKSTKQLQRIGEDSVSSGGWGRVLLYLHIYVGLAIFRGSNSECQYFILGGGGMTWAKLDYCGEFFLNILGLFRLRYRIGFFLGGGGGC